MVKGGFDMSKKKPDEFTPYGGIDLIARLLVAGAACGYTLQSQDMAEIANYLIHCRGSVRHSGSFNANGLDLDSIKKSTQKMMEKKNLSADDLLSINDHIEKIHAFVWDATGLGSKLLKLKEKCLKNQRASATVEGKPEAQGADQKRSNNYNSNSGDL